jgi:cation diffusion facilitator CzcD-associated flavoprotein CzcO
MDTLMQPSSEASSPVLTRVDAVVVGAGLAGLYAHYRLRQLGLSIQGLEAAPEVGGTWFWNRYPGARCDVESLDYCYAFSEELLAEWSWSERFATQPEILRYVNHVADRFDLRRDIAFDTRVVGAVFDEAETLWTVEVEGGAKIRCRYLVATIGALSLPKAPEFEGLQDFQGRWVQTSAWPREPVDYAGKRVAVIGTGSSGMQSIPVLAEQAARLTVFQRTANFSVPAHNGAVDPDHETQVRADYPAYARAIRITKGGQRSPIMTGLSALEVSDEVRLEQFEKAWKFGNFTLQSIFRDIPVNLAANTLVSDFVRDKLRKVVKDPQVAERLTPRGYPLGAKRLVLDTNYWETFNRDHVELVDVNATPIQRITADGVKTSDREYPADLIVFATGFDAMTGPLLALNLQGVGGVSLKDAWKGGPSSYLGVAIAGFPNFFMVNGPGSPSVLTNMITSIEHHVELITDLIGHMQGNRLSRVDVEAEAQSAWADEVRAGAERTLFPLANSWYMGANVPGKPRVFLAYVAGLDVYKARCAQIVEGGYTGFRFCGATPAETSKVLAASVGR